MSDYRVRKNNTLFLVMRLRGGMEHPLFGVLPPSARRPDADGGILDSQAGLLPLSARRPDADNGGGRALVTTAERVADIAERLAEIEVNYASDNYVDERDQVAHEELEQEVAIVHSRMDDIRDSAVALEDRVREIERDFVTDNDIQPALVALNERFEGLGVVITNQDRVIQDLRSSSRIQEVMVNALAFGKELSSTLSSSTSSSGHAAMAVAALRTGEDLAQQIHNGLTSVDGTARYVTHLKRVFALFETEQNKTAEKQVQQENTITELRQQVFSLTDSHHALMRRVAEAQEAPPTRPRRVLPATFGLRNGERARSRSPHREGHDNPTGQQLGLRGGMQLFVKTLTGRTITIDDINEGDIVFALKTMIRMKMHLIFTQSADFYMIFNGLRLDDHTTIDHYNIVSGSTVWMVMRLRGGMIAGAVVLGKNNGFLQVIIMT